MAHGIDRQPITAVHWVPRDALAANAYNPNHVAKPELRLLKLSILRSGWTQPIVARPDGEIVDGFHRWTISADLEIAKLTDGKVPVVYLSADTPMPEQIAATIRHNRARGEHGVSPMAAIVRSLIADHGVEPKAIMRMLGMEGEEVERLADHSGMPTRVGEDAFGNGWVPR